MTSDITGIGAGAEEGAIAAAAIFGDPATGGATMHGGGDIGVGLASIAGGATMRGFVVAGPGSMMMTDNGVTGVGVDGELQTDVCDETSTGTTPIDNSLRNGVSDSAKPFEKTAKPKPPSEGRGAHPVSCSTPVFEFTRQPREPSKA